MQKLKERKIQIVSRNGQAVAPLATSKKTFSFWGLFSSSKSNSRSHSVLLKNSPPQKSHPISPKTDLEAIRNWVALEERIVHDYRALKGSPRRKDPQVSSKTDFGEVWSWVALEERIVHDYKAQRVVPVKPVMLSDKLPVQEKAPIFETLSVPTITSVPSSPGKRKKPSPEGKRSFFRVGTAVLALGWMLAGLFAYFYAGEISLRQDIALKLAESQGKNEQLGWSAAILNTTATDQRGELQKINGQLRTVTGALGKAQAKAAAYTAMEKSYRDELLRVTTQYEEQIDGMRKFIQVRDEFVKTLHAHVQAIERLVSKDGLTAAFSAAVKAMEDQNQKPLEKAAPRRTALPQGEVMMVNRQYQFFVVNLGAEQGAVTGGLINIFQDGKLLTKGRLERVYPSMSAGTVLDDEALQAVREGDEVSFSSK